MYIKVIMEVAAAIFAVYGLYVFLKGISEYVFPPESYQLAVWVKGEYDYKKIYERLCYAQICAERERGADSLPIILVEPKYALDDEHIAELRELGFPVYVAEEI